MATIKVKAPKTNLQKTKQANTSSPRSYTPRVNTPRAPYSRGGDNMTGIINTAAAHPAETLGYTLGSYLGNYLERGRDRYQGEEENRILGSVLDRFNNAPQEPFDGDYGKMDMNANEQGYLASQAQPEPSQAITPQSVAGPYDDAAKAAHEGALAGQRMFMSGQPMTAAAVNALGLSPVDQAKQAVVDGRLRDYAEYGPNASRARRQEEQMYRMADQAKNMNLATMPTSQLEAMIDQQLQGTKMSWRRQQDAKANILKRLQQQGAEQANAQALDMLAQYNQFDPNSKEAQDMESQIYKAGTDFMRAGQEKAGLMLMTPLLQRRAFQTKLDQYRQQEELKTKFDVERHSAKRMFDAEHPVARGRSSGGGSRRSSGTPMYDDEGNDLGITDKEYDKMRKRREALVTKIATLKRRGMKDQQFDANNQPVSNLLPEEEKQLKRYSEELEDLENVLLQIDDPKAFDEKRARTSVAVGNKRNEGFETPYDKDEDDENKYYLP